MTQRKAFRYLCILLSLSLLLIGAGLILRRLKPELYPVRDQAAAARRAGKKQDERPGDEFPLGDNDPAKVKSNERSILVWPETSILPEYHKVDLSIYRDRGEGSKTLEGIIIFIDAGESQALPEESSAPSEVETARQNLAPTDPVTGFPVSDYNRETMAVREEMEKRVPRGEILAQLGKLFGKRLERLGATVLYTREMGSAANDVSQAAVVGKELSGRFIKELAEQNFRCTPLENLRPILSSAVTDPSTPECRKLFSANGVGPELRLLLDVERQYADVLLISLRLGESDNMASSFNVRYFGGSTAANFGATALSEDRPGDQPAYLGYSSYRRRSFAEIFQKRVSGLLQEYPSDSSGKNVSEASSLIGRFTNVVGVEASIGSAHSDKDMEMLSKEDFLKSLAEAMSSGVQQFYQH